MHWPPLRCGRGLSVGHTLLSARLSCPPGLLWPHLLPWWRPQAEPVLWKHLPCRSMWLCTKAPRDSHPWPQQAGDPGEVVTENVLQWQSLLCLLSHCGPRVTGDGTWTQNLRWCKSSWREELCGASPFSGARPVHAPSVVSDLVTVHDRSRYHAHFIGIRAGQPWRTAGHVPFTECVLGTFCCKHLLWLSMSKSLLHEGTFPLWTICEVRQTHCRGSERPVFTFLGPTCLNLNPISVLTTQTEICYPSCSVCRLEIGCNCFLDCCKHYV